MRKAENLKGGVSETLDTLTRFSKTSRARGEGVRKSRQKFGDGRAHIDRRVMGHHRQHHH